VEGSLISWVSHHRRHHVYADRAGDPHSPHTCASGPFRRLRGLGHAHVGWLFSGAQSDPAHWSSDLLADHDVCTISRFTPLWMALSLVLPFGIGWVVTQSLTGALLALLWAGAVRIALLHHVTWSVALFSFGDSWHNSHHAFPIYARHGCDRHQLDPSATLLRGFERLGWASDVRWPIPERLARRLAS